MICAAAISDLAAITSIRTSVNENHLSVADMAARGITHEMIAGEIQRGILGAWVAETADGIVAFAMANCERASLWALFTRPDAERQGHASALLNAAENWLRSKGVAVATLDTARGSRAEAFYRKRGWEEYTPANGEPRGVHLRKTL